MRRTASKSPLDSKAKILVIDSDPAMITLLSAYLEGEKGYAVLTAESGAGGIKTAVEHVPDLILLDFWLSDMGGLEVHDRLRLIPATKGIPIVYVSSFLTFRAVEQASSKGARGFLRKPFTPSDIHKKVVTVLGSV